MSGKNLSDLDKTARCRLYTKSSSKYTVVQLRRQRSPSFLRPLVRLFSVPFFFSVIQGRQDVTFLPFLVWNFAFFNRCQVPKFKTSMDQTIPRYLLPNFGYSLCCYMWLNVSDIVVSVPSSQRSQVGVIIFN